MNNKKCNNDRILTNLLNNEKKYNEEYLEKNTDSLIPDFKNALNDLGFEFETPNQALGFLPKYKDKILPVVILFYEKAKKTSKYNEMNYFIKFFHFKGFEEVVPMLIEDFYNQSIPELTKWFISDVLYQIRSEKYEETYINIISEHEFGQNRQMIILLVGKLKIEKAIPILIKLLDDETVRIHAISALSDFQKKELQYYFENFINSKNPTVRKYAKNALKKLIDIRPGDNSLSY